MANQSTGNSEETRLIFSDIVPSVTGEENDNDTLYITPDGSASTEPTEMYKFDLESGQWIKIPSPASCPGPMTRAQLRALRTAGGLSKDCHYVITNPSSNGTLDVQKIILHAVDESTLSNQAGILTSHSLNAYQGIYDIDQDDVLEVTDHLENKVISNASILNFPFGVSAVNGNTVMNRANVIYTSGNFINNVVDTDATVTVSGVNVVRNEFKAASNTTITGGDFRNNIVYNDATVTSSTTGDVDNNTFGNLSLTNISGTSNLDNSVINSDANVTMTGGTVVNSKFEQLSNYTMSGGILRESTVGQDADVIIISGDNYENTFGHSTLYRQVGTGYIRYSSIEGNTTWTNGNTNISNVTAFTATVNTTGSTGTISNSTLNRAYMVSLNNIPSLTIQDTTVTDYANVSGNNAAKIFLYRCNVSGGSRILGSTGTTIEASYTNLDSYSYIQSTGNGGVFRVNYTNLSSYSYTRNLSTNPNYVERCDISSQGNIRFDGTANNCRVYYTQVSSGAAVYHTTGSVGCYIYYCTANSLGQLYTSGSTNARLYYNNVDSYSYIRSTNCTATHYIYYAKAMARGYVQQIGNTGLTRFYAVTSQEQSIMQLRDSSAGNIYYSSISAFFYLYATRTSGTLLGAFGQGRLTKTGTQQTVGTPYSQNNAFTNIL